ncbi:hypothetical protein, conserved [Eimeria brunetti]|uniref:Uncharacterized protein n=1 Tax=Eimeria brunetti TaxID=51314 RepID=U6LC26_9EIME|nr:hypothetical protein, conserved [Eimeria brunetti]
MPAELVAPILLAKGAGANFLGGAGPAALSAGLGGLSGLAAATPMGMAGSAIGSVAGGAIQQAAAAGGSPDVIEQSLYFLPLLAPMFTGAGRTIRSEEQRTIRLSTADSRGARYAEFL